MSVGYHLLATGREGGLGNPCNDILHGVGVVCTCCELEEVVDVVLASLAGGKKADVTHFILWLGGLWCGLGLIDEEGAMGCCTRIGIQDVEQRCREGDVEKAMCSRVRVARDVKQEMLRKMSR